MVLACSSSRVSGCSSSSSESSDSKSSAVVGTLIETVDMPAGASHVSITVPTTAEEFESEDSEDDDNEHPLTRDELHAKTIRSLTKREASVRKGAKRAQPRR